LARSQDLIDYARSDCLRNLKIIKSSWEISGFGAVAIIKSITIKNSSKHNCKNVLGGADFYSANGTFLGATPFIIYDTVPAGKTRTFRDINIGFLPNDQVKSAEFTIASGIQE
jgi:hypothetical protein